MRNVLSTLKIGFDLDGVLAHTDAASVAWYQRHGLLSADKTAADITAWNHVECLGVDDRDTIRMFTDPQFFDQIVPDEDGCAVLNALKYDGAEIHIVTSRPCAEVTSAWLSRYEIPYDRLEFRSGDEKPHYAKDWGLDFFIEDHPRTALDLARTVGRLSFLRDKPYNRCAMEHAKLLRFYRWDDMADFFMI